MNKVEVWWIDAIGFQGWHDEDKIDCLVKDYIIKSRGYLVKKNKLFFILAQSYDHNHRFGNLLFIPRKTIIKIK